MLGMLARWTALTAIGSVVAASSAYSAQFAIVNSTGATLDELYISRCGGPHWGANQLKGTPVLSSRAFTISNIRPGCYDVMVVIPPWNECVVTGVALIRNVAWTLTWSTVIQSQFGDCSLAANVVSAGRRPMIEDVPR